MICLADMTLSQEELEELLRDLPQIVLELETCREGIVRDE